MAKTKSKKRTNPPAYIIGRGCAGWHAQHRETWSMWANEHDPANPLLSGESCSTSGMSEDDARRLVVRGCVCYDFDSHGYDGGVQACRLPSRCVSKEEHESEGEYAIKVWRALFGMQGNWPFMRCGIATVDGQFPWETAAAGH